MLSHHVGSLPVLEGDGLVGILTVTDLLEHELEFALATPATGRTSPVPVHHAVRSGGRRGRYLAV
jgi:CBS domain-containing protein